MSTKNSFRFKKSTLASYAITILFTLCLSLSSCNKDDDDAGLTPPETSEDSQGGSSESSSDWKYFNASAKYSDSDGSNWSTSLKNAARRLNSSGIKIHKRNNSYYWEDYHGRSHNVRPGSYRNEEYAYVEEDYMYGQKGKFWAKVTVSFSFTKF